MSKRLTIGMRCRFKPEEAKDHSWRGYAGHEVLLVERSQGSFSVMILGKGKNVELKREDPNTVINQVAWVDEDDLEYADSDFATNLDFMDWYQENGENFCGDCGAWFPNNGGREPDTNEDCVCPNEDCPGRLYDSGICPTCRTAAPEKGDICPKCEFDWRLQY